MSRNQKIKRYFKNHPDATMDDYNNQLHKMHVQQSKNFTRSRHSGSKNQKTIMSKYSYDEKIDDSFVGKLMRSLQ